MTRREKTYEWDDIICEYEEGYRGPTTVIIVAGSLDEARQRVRESGWFKDKPEVLDKKCKIR